MRRLLPEAAVTEWTDASGSLSLSSATCPTTGPAASSSSSTRAGFRLVALTRAGEARLVAADVVGQEGDILHLAVRTDAVEELDARGSAGATRGRTRCEVAIAGAGNVGTFIAADLRRPATRCSLIEQDPDLVARLRPPSTSSGSSATPAR